MYTDTEENNKLLLQGFYRNQHLNLFSKAFFFLNLGFVEFIINSDVR